MTFIFRVLIFLMLIPAACAFAQKDSISLNSIVDKTAKYSEQIPLEKLYLHFDKPYYALGDTVWFKAYLTANAHQPSPYSKIIYVELIAGRDSIVEILKLAVNKSTAQGSFTLNPERYSQGNYRIRAYTNWMFNFSDQFFFNKNLLVGDAIKKELSTHARLNLTGTKKNEILAQITYKDENGKPYADKKLSWKVIVDYDAVEKGKGKTDANGNFSLTLGENKKVSLRSGTLQTVLEVTEGKNISTSYPLAKAYDEKDFQLFPEGGDFLTGLPVRVAFKAIKSDGLGVSVKGEIVDNLGNKVLDITSQHLGMGSVTFAPEAGKTYKANVTFADGSTGSYPLPASKDYGIALKINNSSEEAVGARIAATTSFLARNTGKTFYLIARSGGIVCYAAQFKLQGQVVNTSIPKDKFPAGIMQLSLLGVDGEPLSERLVFIENAQKIDLNVKADKASYLAHQKVKMNLSSRFNASPLEGDFSVSVVDETRVPHDQDAQTTILSSLLLNSDLSGYIEKPNYYFNEKNPERKEDLDLLLLTQGYRSFAYKDIINNAYPKISFLPEQGITISGILRYNNGMPVSKGNVRLIIPDKSFGVSAVTDAEGRFKFSNVMFNDSSKVTLSALNNYNSKNMVFTLDGTPYAAVAPNPNAAEEVLNIDSALNTYISNSKKQYFNSRMLREVVIKSRVIEKKVNHTSYSGLSGLNMMADHEISADRFKGCSNFLQCLQGSAMGLVYENDNFYISRNYMAGNKTPVQVYVRDMPVDVAFLNSVNPADVESVEIFRSDGLSGINKRNNTSGVVVVNMKEVKKSNMKLSDLKDFFPSSNQLTFTPKGYSKVRKFYVPKFDVAPTLNKQDYRTTIYWNPALITDATGNASFEYVTAEKGKYITVIEGIDKEGRLGRQVFRFEVK